MDGWMDGCMDGWMAPPPDLQKEVPTTGKITYNAINILPLLVGVSFHALFQATWPETTINYTMIYYIATMAIAFWSMSLGY